MVKYKLKKLLEYYLTQLDNNELSEGMQELLWTRLTEKINDKDTQKDVLKHYFLGYYVSQLVSNN